MFVVFQRLQEGEKIDLEFQRKYYPDKVKKPHMWKQKVSIPIC